MNVIAGLAAAGLAASSLSLAPGLEHQEAFGQPNTFQAPPAHHNKMYIIGDSIACGVLSTGGLEKVLRDEGWDLQIHRAVGRPLVGSSAAKSCDLDAHKEYPGIYETRLSDDEKAIKQADVILTILGTNDYAEAPQVQKEAAKSYIEHLDELNPKARKLWADTFLKGHGLGYDQMNKAIKASGVDEMIRWGSIAPPYYTDSPDGIHPAARGYKALANLIHQSVKKPS